MLYGKWSEAWGHEAVARLWDGGGAQPDGIFCGNDQIARGVLDALRERGVTVPDDVSVVGFDNWEIVAAATRPPLTTIDMNLKALGREAGRLILALSEGKAVEPGIRKLPCSFGRAGFVRWSAAEMSAAGGVSLARHKGTAAGGDGFATAG